jgi:hypothetical protein
VKCYYLLPSAEPLIISWKEPLPECLLEEGHKGEHLILTKRSRYFVWASYTDPCGDDCECVKDMSYLGYECFTYGEISNEQAQKLLAAKKR